MVDMEIEWMSRGMMIYHITRGCSDAKIEKHQQLCKEGATDLAQSKKCNFACNYDGCNNGE